jgi:hypothetical protein
MNSSKTTIKVESNVEKADVIYKGRKVGTTPTEFKVKNDIISPVIIKKEGYHDMEVPLYTSTSPWVFGNIIFGYLGVLGVMHDTSSGASLKVVPRNFKANLPKIKKGEKKKTIKPYIVDNEKDMSGPRLGFSFLSQEIRNNAKKEENIDLPPIISQFGWHSEMSFNIPESPITPLTEFIVLVGGVEQEVFIPSLTAVIGFRTKKTGFELAMGPNISASGTALTIGLGKTLEFGKLEVPVNVAFVPSKSGFRMTFLTGFRL